MENASKALIIAGAILIAIVLITVGVAVLNQGSDVANQSSLEGAQLTAFNQKFSQYEGTKSGSQVKALLNAVMTNNQAEKNQGGNTVTINKIGDISSTSEIGGKKIFTSTQYTVKCEYNGGRVVNITISGGTNDNKIEAQSIKSEE